MTSLDVRKVIGSSPISSTKDTLLSLIGWQGFFYARKWKNMQKRMQSDYVRLDRT